MGASKGKILLDYKENLQGARYAFAGMNFMADPADLPIEEGQCPDIVNCDVDIAYNVSRRQGFAQVINTPVHSCWSNNEYTYCVHNDKISIFNGSNIVPISTSPTIVGEVVEFKQCNNVIVYSDNTNIGIIDNNVCYPIDKLNQWVDVTDVETWVQTNYPADPTQLPSNFEVDAFKLKTFAGMCLEFFNGTLYMAVDNFVYCTKAFDMEHMDIRYNVVAGFPESVTMIARVSDGLFIGTTKSIYFLSGTGYTADENGVISGGFTQRQVAKYGAVYGTQVRVQAHLVPDAQASDTVILFATPIGVLCGSNGGKITNLSQNQIAMPYGTSGAAIFKEDKGIYQYIVSFNDVQGSSFINQFVN